MIIWGLDHLPRFSFNIPASVPKKENITKGPISDVSGFVANQLLVNADFIT